MGIQKRNYNENALDMFRVFATIQVFLGHIITHFSMENPPTQVIYFFRGVPILFVLSGFLAAKSIENRSTKEYLIGRAIRILPEFWVCILINTIIILLFYPTHPTLIEAVTYIITQLCGLNFYTGEWLRGYGVGTPNGVLWTIAVQIQFFLLVPIISKFLKKTPLKKQFVGIIGLSIVSLFLNNLEGVLPTIFVKLIGVSVLPYLYFLLFGMMIWYYRDSIIPKFEKYRWIILIAYVIWEFCTNWIAAIHYLDGVLYNIVTTLLLASLISGFGFRKRLRMPNDYTYGFYLYHMVFINIAVELGIVSFMPLVKGIILTVVIAIITVMAAYLSNHLIARPVNRFLNTQNKNNK